MEKPITPIMTDTQDIRRLHTAVAIMTGLGYSNVHCWAIVNIVRGTSRKIDISFLDLLGSLTKELQHVGVKLSLSEIESLVDSEAG